LFPELNQRAVLLLAEGFGGSTTHISISRLDSARDLRVPFVPSSSDSVTAQHWVSDNDRVQLSDIPQVTKDLYQSLADHPKVYRLGEVVDLTIGYVTGDNDFFHLTPDEAREWGLDYADIRPVLRRSGDLNGLGLTCRVGDFVSRFLASDYYLYHPEGTELRPAARAYMEYGRDLGVHERYKCRVRDPWYVVPRVRVPEFFIGVFASNGPRLVANRANLAATNTLLIGNSCVDWLGQRVLVASSLTSLSLLSAEIEGHALGGGALKLEPGEARRLLVPVRVDVHDDLLLALDRFLRQDKLAEASALADDVFLIGGIGMSYAQVQILRNSLAHLREKRQRRKGE